MYKLGACLPIPSVVDAVRLQILGTHVMVMPRDVGTNIFDSSEPIPLR